MTARPPRLWPWILIPAAALVAVVAFAIIGFVTFGAARPWPWWGFFPWFPFVGIWIFFGFLFLFGVFRGWGGPWGWRDDGFRGGEDRSGAILRERYARGEITRDQFDEMHRSLDEHRKQNAYDDEAARSAGP